MGCGKRVEKPEQMFDVGYWMFEDTRDSHDCGASRSDGACTPLTRAQRPLTMASEIRARGDMGYGMWDV